MNRALVIAIDGPAAAGKGTLARRLAAYFGLPYLDTGLLYRAVARSLLDRGLSPGDRAAAKLAAETLKRGDLARTDLRTPEVDRAASVVAAQAGVRAALLSFQQRFPTDRGAVLDGRDIGTVVLPEATIKLFVTATLETRALRRLRELTKRGIVTDLRAVMSEIAERDEQDRVRPIGPLRRAPEAIVIDTTSLDPDAAFSRARTLAERRIAAEP